MSGAGSGEGTYVYVISCTLERVKIGVADDPRKRLRELQVGSPVELTLAHTQPYAERRDAVAVCEELYRCFARRRVRGGWYRLTPEAVRHGFGRRATVEAPERARAAAAAAEEDSRFPPRRKQSGKRTEKQLAYERRRRQQRTRTQKRAARLLGEGMTQEQAAAAVGVTTRTLRNWKAAPAFRRELERQREHAARPPASAPSSAGKPRPRRDADGRRDRAAAPRPGAGPQPDRPSTTPPAQQQTVAEQTPTTDLEQDQRNGLPVAAEQRADAADPPRSTSISRHDGVPIFPDTRDGRAARLAYYEARKLNNPPYSLLDYNDAKHGLEPPAERRARQRRDNRRPR